jgi:MFS family permease
LGINRLIRVPGNLVAGILNDRLGRRRLFLSGLSLGIISTLSYGLVRGFWPLFAGRMLWGIAWALINVSGFTMVVDWSTAADRGRLAGLYQMAYMIGLTISPLIGGVLTDHLGFRSAVLVCAAISATGLLVAWVALPETRPPRTALLPAQVTPNPGSGSTQQAPETQAEPAACTGDACVAPTVRAASHATLRAGYLYFVTLFVGSGVLVSTVALYLGQRWGTAVQLNGMALGVATLAGMMLATRALLGMLASPLAGSLSDRLCRRPGSSATGRKPAACATGRWPVVRGGVLLGVVGFLMLALVVSVWAVVGGVALVAVSTGTLVTCLVAIVGDQAQGERPGATMGRLATAGDLGSAAGPFVAYALVPLLNLRWIYLLSALVLASGLLATLRAPRGQT